MATEPEKETKRIVADIPVEQHRELSSILALQGFTMADWVRDKVTEELKVQHEN